MATLFGKPTGIWYINYSVNGKRFKKSTGAHDKKLAQVKFDDLKVKLFKGEMGAKPSAGKKTVVSEFLRRYIECLNTNSHLDNHSDLTRIRSLQDFFARKGVRYIA